MFEAGTYEVSGIPIGLWIQRIKGGEVGETICFAQRFVALGHMLYYHRYGRFAKPPI
jgi:hypothetical protein